MRSNGLWGLSAVVAGIAAFSLVLDARAGLPLNGACCFHTAAGGPVCQEGDPNQCAGVQGQFFLGLNCGDINVQDCTVITGACCRGVECVNAPASQCDLGGGIFHGTDTTCIGTANPCVGRCCLHDSNCANVDEQFCFNELQGVFWQPGTQCSNNPCPPTGACCLGPGDCLNTSRELCGQVYHGTYQGDGTPCDGGCVPVEACCGPEGRCAEMPVAQCESLGGTRLGPGSHCKGDNNQNNQDDACEPEPPCSECGPGPHWVDQCSPGHDNMPSGAEVGIDLDGDCVADTSVVLGGPVFVYRSAPSDDSSQYPGLRNMDGHLDVMDTEMLSMNLTGGAITLVAGAGYGDDPLRPTRGAIAELPGDPATAHSFFDVFFELSYGAGQHAYNHDPLRVESDLTCLPPNTQYIHPTGCLPLYSKPVGGTFVANLVSANHFTYPGCCFGNFCTNLPVEICKQEQGRVVPDCLGDANHNEINDACEPPICRPDETGLRCLQTQCDSAVNTCEPRCATYNPAIGQIRLSECDCGNSNGCHLVSDILPSVAGAPIPDCEVPDNGSGTAQLPPPGCPYLSPDQVHMIIDGLPPGTTIQLGVTHQQFICEGGVQSVCSFNDVDCSQFGGSLGGEQECARSFLSMEMHGTGGLAGFFRSLNVPTSFETEIGPRMFGDPTQSFDTDMFRLQGQLPPGDPDFDLLRITAGNDFGLPSPGHTTLLRLPNGNWSVDSFFDITYRIDFVGHPGPGRPLGGMSGSTTGTIRMQTNQNLRCRGGCGDPAGAPNTVCTGKRSVNSDGVVTLCCGCEDIPKEACCLPEGGCAEIPPAKCRELGGQRLGVGSHCKGDNNQNGRDDACENSHPCDACGPGPHWVDQCGGGTDHMLASGLVGIDTNFDCVPDTTVALKGAATVARKPSMDDSLQFPGTRPVDGHHDVIDTEMLELNLTGGGVTLNAGAGFANVPIRPTLGTMAEEFGDSSLADSFFDVFVEFDLGGGHFAYNHDPVRMEAKGLTCVPPVAAFLHPDGCLPLFSSPDGGVLVANLVKAQADTYPTGACCFRGGRCADLPPTACEEQHGRPHDRGTTCDQTFCPKPGDLDHDGDVDVKDHALFVTCLKGPHVLVIGDCVEADLDGDGDVDMQDAASFFDIFTELP